MLNENWRSAVRFQALLLRPGCKRREAPAALINSRLDAEAEEGFNPAKTGERRQALATRRSSGNGWCGGSPLLCLALEKLRQEQPAAKREETNYAPEAASFFLK
jgi:hypothetical protein